MTARGESSRTALTVARRALTAQANSIAANVRSSRARATRAISTTAPARRSDPASSSRPLAALRCRPATRSARRRAASGLAFWRPMEVDVLPGTLAICRLRASDRIPSWALELHEGFVSITRTPDELSIVCPQEAVPPDTEVEEDWRALMIPGPIPFEATGVLSALTVPLAEAGIPIFAISTFDTDYVLVREQYVERALHVLHADPERRRISSGSPYEPVIGFSRAVRAGAHVLVSGTGPVMPDGGCPESTAARPAAAGRSSSPPWPKRAPPPPMSFAPARCSRRRPTPRARWRRTARSSGTSAPLHDGRRPRPARPPLDRRGGSGGSARRVSARRLGVDRRQRVLDRLLAQVERRGDLLVGAPFADQRGDGLLALGQRRVAARGGPRGLRRAPRALRSSRPRPRGHVRARPTPASAAARWSTPRTRGRPRRRAPGRRPSAPRARPAARPPGATASARSPSATASSARRRAGLAAGEQDLGLAVAARRMPAAASCGRRDCRLCGPALGVVELAGGDRGPHEPQQQPRPPGGVRVSISEPPAASMPSIARRGSSSSAAKSHAAVRVSLLGSTSAVSRSPS